MASLNKVLLLGHLTRDPELRYTANGTSVATVGLAVNRRYRQGDETKEDVCFIAETTSWALPPSLPAGQLATTGVHHLCLAHGAYVACDPGSDLVERDDDATTAL